jgi:hypothetical protein
VELQDQLEVRPLELWMANADVTPKKVGALPSLMMGCARFMGFHIPYKHITLEALDPVSRCDRDWVGLTWRMQVRRGMQPCGDRVRV